MKNRQHEEAKATFKLSLIQDYDADQRRKKQKELDNMIPDSPTSIA